MKIKICVILLLLVFIGCKSEKENRTGEIATSFFETYAARKDYNKLASFYKDKVEYENVIQNTEINTFESAYLINTIFAWNDTALKYNNDKMIEVDNIVSNDSVAVVSGKFNSYTYNGNQFGAMKFTTFLYFDKDLKIKKQID